MRIAAIHNQNNKIFGTMKGGLFHPLLVKGAPASELRDVMALVNAGALARGAPLALDKVKLAAPVGPLVKNVMAVGKNYHDHAEEFARSGVDHSGDKQEVPEW